MDELTHDAPTPETEDETPTAALENTQLFQRICVWYKQSQSGFDRWRKKAEDAFNFVAGHQWTDEEKAQMEADGRPLLTFDRLGPVIDVVVGSEINNRQEVTAKPRDNTDAQVAEVSGDVIEFLRDDADADDAEGDSFRDNLIAGMGWNEIRVQPAGSRDYMAYEHVDPFEMRWPPGIKSKNLRGAPWLLRVRSIDRLAAEEMLPGHNWQALNASWAKSYDSEGGPHSIDPANRYSRDGTDPDDDAPDRVTVVEAQWIAREPVYRTPDPETGQEVEIDAAMAAQLQSAPILGSDGQPRMWPVSQTMQRAAYRAFVGASEVLEKVRLPTQQHGMTYVCQTGKWDRKDRLFYGIVRAATDPQRFANKSVSLFVEIMAAGAKGGILAEADAFEDEDAARRDWASPSSILFMNTGGLAKVKDRPAPQYPAGWDRLFQLSLQAIPAATGVNPEMLGLRDAQQPGILEYHRKQAAVTVLAHYFDSLRRARKQGAEVMLALAIELLDDAELARIVGPEKAPLIPALKQAGVERFDIIIDESPQSANAKERTWAAMQPLLPMMAQMGLPMEVWAEVLRASPIPASMVEKIIQHLEAAQQQPPDPAAEKMKQLAIRKAEVDIEDKAAEAGKTRAETVTEQLDAMIKAAEARAAAGDRMEQRVMLNGG